MKRTLFKTIKYILIGVLIFCSFSCSKEEEFCNDMKPVPLYYEWEIMDIDENINVMHEGVQSYNMTIIATKPGNLTLKYKSYYILSFYMRDRWEELNNLQEYSDGRIHVWIDNDDDTIFHCEFLDCDDDKIIYYPLSLQAGNDFYIDIIYGITQ